MHKVQKPSGARSGIFCGDDFHMATKVKGHWLLFYIHIPKWFIKIPG